MAQRLAAYIALTIALLAAPAGAFAADVVEPSSVVASTTVPAGGSSTLTLRCPASAVALNAAVTKRGAGVTVRRSLPGRDPGDWRFRLSAADGAERRGVRAVLRCVRLELPAGVSRARLFVSTSRSPAIELPAASSTAVEIRCRGGFVATGYGLDSGGRRDVRIAAAVPVARGWTFRLENTGSSPASARLRVRCLERTVSARRGGAPTQLVFRVARRAFSNRVGPGAGRFFSHSCPAGKFSVATGSVVDPADDIVLSGSHPLRSRSGRWAFGRASAGDRVRSFLVCLGRRPQFGGPGGGAGALASRAACSST
jgi:hypothetical protein